MREEPVEQPSAPAAGRSGAAGAYACILTAAALWGMIGLWSRNLSAAGLSPWSIVAVRNIGGFLLLTAVLAVRDRSVFCVERRHLKYFFGTGVVSVLLFTLCYFSCQAVCSLAAASILLYTAPAFVVVLAAALWREPVTGRKLSALGLTLLGCALVSGVFSGRLRMTPAGFLLGLLAGFFYALYTIFGRYALGHYRPITVTYWTFAFAAAGSLFILRPSELAAAFARPRVWPLAAALTVLSTVLPFLLYTRGLARAEAGRASILASVEPVAAAAVGVCVFGEPMDAMTLAGIACVLGGVCILQGKGKT